LVPVVAIAALLAWCGGVQGDRRVRVVTGSGDMEFSEAYVDSITFTCTLETSLIPAGDFTMGDGVAQCGVDERDVTLTHDFRLGTHEVTNAEYMELLQWAYDNGYATAFPLWATDQLEPGIRRLINLDEYYSEIAFDAEEEKFYLDPSGTAIGIAYPDGYDPADHPVRVTWFGAVRFCDWLSMREGLPRAYEHSGDWACNGGDPYGAEGYRLPTDAEWEFAAQYDNERIYPWGNDAPACYWLNYDDCVGWTAPVEQWPAPPGALGLHSMAGNLSEWCNDWFECDLGTTPETDPVGPTTGERRIARGTSYNASGDEWARCAKRSAGWIGDPNYTSLGFRIARTVSD
jgi:formylglycine-generating enzyme required for sulfatase activity